MYLKKFIIPVIGIIALYFVLGYCLSLFGVIKEVTPIPGWSMDTPNMSPGIKRITSEAPIVQHLPNGALRSVSIQFDEENNPFFTIDDLDNINSQIHVRTGSGSSFEVTLVKDHKIGSWDHVSSDSIVVISDIDGNFDAFVSFLQGNHVIDKNFNWTFGDNRLVLLGDFFDRGREVFECLWLIYKLEQEAIKKGGYVHFILGNHEMMNLRGSLDKKSLKYVDKKYFNNAEFIDIPYPAWVNSHSEIGRWLRTKNCIEKIGSVLFTHGGISIPLYESGLSLEEINTFNRELLDLHVLKFNEQHRLISYKDGPMWYRGMAQEELTDQQVDLILENYHVDRIVIGHTIMRKDNISTFYNKKVIAVDLNHRASFKKGVVRGLLITNGELFEIDNHNNRENI
jgi:hypothetical protein